MRTKCIIIDDEPNAISILKDRITEYCPDLELIGTANNPKSGLLLIESVSPELIFLDISMPGMSGFDLLSQIPEPEFEIIFVTAFDQYALEAIQNCAIGYILKPIDNEELRRAVKRATTQVDLKAAAAKNALLIENLSIEKHQKRKIAIPTSEGMELILIEDIVHLEGQEGYCSIHINGRKPLLSSYNIGHYAKLLLHKNFYQVHKSHLINVDHIQKYHFDGYLYLSNDQSVPVSFSRRKEFKAFLRRSNLL